MSLTSTMSQLKATLSKLPMKMIVLGTSFLLLFTVGQISTYRLRTFATQALDLALLPMGVLWSSESIEVSIFFRPGITLTNLTLEGGSLHDSLTIREVRISPSYSSFLRGFLAAELKIALPSATPFIVVGARGQTLLMDITADQVDFTEFPIFALLSGINAEGKLNVRARVTGQTSDAKSWNGLVEVDSDKLTLPNQTVSGIALPKITLSKNKVKIPIENGTAKIESFILGDQNGDDLKLRLQGLIQLHRSILDSSLDLGAHLQLSESITKNLSILSLVLGSYQTKPNQYEFQLGGSLRVPVPAPKK